MIVIIDIGFNYLTFATVFCWIWKSFLFCRRTGKIIWIIAMQHIIQFHGEKVYIQQQLKKKQQ